MEQKIQIADKPTLDNTLENTNSLLEHTGTLEESLLSDATYKILGKIMGLFSQGCAVVYNNEIHILGSLHSTTQHYKWDGTTWTRVSALPYEFTYGCAVVFNNEIHILGSKVSGNETKHYKWDGTTWTRVSALPYNFYYGCAVVFNNEIHILGGSGKTTGHYKWDGSTWTSVATLPYGFTKGCAVVYNNSIRIFGSDIVPRYFGYYYPTNSSWGSSNTLPYDFYGGSAVVYNNEIHLIGSEATDYTNKHYRYSTSKTYLGKSSFMEDTPLPYGHYWGCAVILNDEIHLLGGGDGNIYYKHHALVFNNILSKIKFIEEQLEQYSPSRLSLADWSDAVTVTNTTKTITVSKVRKLRIVLSSSSAKADSLTMTRLTIDGKQYTVPTGSVALSPFLVGGSNAFATSIILEIPCEKSVVVTIKNSSTSGVSISYATFI